MMLPPLTHTGHISTGNFENLQYMFSKGFQNLTSLQSLYISDCSKLTAHPDKDMLLSLEELWFRGCPLLKEECKSGKGREWSKIAHIIDWDRIILKELNGNSTLISPLSNNRL